MGGINNSFEKTSLQIAESTGCDLQSRKMAEFSETEYAQKTPVRIANEGQRTGAIQISTAYFIIGKLVVHERMDKS